MNAVSSLLKKVWRHRWLFRAMVDGRVPPPTWAIIDPVTICNLRCVFCPTGTNKLKLEQRMMSLDEYEAILCKMPFLKEVYLYNWGEPLLNPAFPEMVACAKGKQIATSIDTNLSLPMTAERVKAVVASGLDSMTISLDGASQETYERYRRGGNFERVISNIRAFVSVKAELSSQTPVITWKFIVNKFNEHEIPRAREMAKELGIVFNLSGMAIPKEFETEWAPSGVRVKTADEIWYPRSICTYMFQSIVINSDGSVLPCCHVTNRKYSYGNLLQDDFNAIWNGAQYRLTRSMMVPVLFKPRSGGRPEAIPCGPCKSYSTMGAAVKQRIRDYLAARKSGKCIAR